MPIDLTEARAQARRYRARGDHIALGAPLLIEQMADEIERLRAIEDTAINLIEEIRKKGTHQRWKRLANVLEQNGYRGSNG